MLHYLLNTGEIRRTGDVRREAGPTAPMDAGPMDAPAMDVAPMLAGGRFHLSLGGGGRALCGDYVCLTTVVGRALLAIVFRGAWNTFPCVAWYVAPDDATADRVWPAWSRAYLEISWLSHLPSRRFAPPLRPAKAPWSAVAVICATPEEAAAIADFERALSWAWVERGRGRA